MNRKQQIKEKLSKTLEASKLIFHSRKYTAVFTTVTVGFLAMFLIAMQDITFNESFTTGLVTVSDPLQTMFETRAPFQWEPVAGLDAGFLSILISPLNIGLGLLLGVLTGLNLTFSYIAWRQPKICSVNKSTGLLSSVPALLAGSACCAPIILIILGIQVTTALLVFMSILIPIALILLIVNLVVSADKVRLDKLRENVGKQ